MVKKKKALPAKAKASSAVAISKSSRRASKEERRARKLALRKKEKKGYTADMWAEPAPSHLVAKLDVPRVKSKYQSYFEFAANPEKKDKRLEFKVVDESDPPPGFVFVPIGDPILTNACKELSREKGAMIFIVSSMKEEKSKISEHIHRTGYHFREVIVDEAREIVGETVVSQPAHRYGKGEIEPIPESQEEINTQADAAIRDLFPRIPNTDRTMIIEHAFKKGAMFHGEPTVGLQTNIPLSRRVQLAVLAHIRHTHTRYDKLLKETTWMNARKVVEPVCLDVLVKWRGDEETGRDQMDEIIREVVIITDSEDEDDSSDDEDSSEEEGEVSSASSTEPPSQSTSRDQERLPSTAQQVRPLITVNPGATEDENMEDTISLRTRTKPQKDKRAQRGFKRYQAAWDEALQRRQHPSHATTRAHSGTPLDETTTRRPQSTGASPRQGMQKPMRELTYTRPTNLAPDFGRDDQARYYVDSMNTKRPAPYYSNYRTTPGPSTQRNEVIVRPQAERRVYHQDVPPSLGTPSYATREQRPSQVVRGSSTTQVLSDLLVPSIEPVPSDVALPCLSDELGVHESINYSHDSRPRRVIEHQVHSPAPQPRAIINDDSPEVKRRRLIREDDAGHFRPLPSRDPSLSHTYPDSHLISTSSSHSGDFLMRHPRVSSQSAQGLFRANQPSFIDPATAERLPVFDAPESGYFKTHPGYLRRIDEGPPGQQQQRPIMRQVGSPQPPRDSVSDGAYPWRPTYVQKRGEKLEMVESNRHIRQVEPDYSHGSHIPRPLSPSFPVFSRISRSHGASLSSVGPDQDFIHSFSQSGLDGHVSHARDGFTILAERAPQSFVSQRAFQDREDYSTRSFATGPSTRARSPVKYVERPIGSSYYTDEPHQPVYYERNQPIPRDRYVPHDRLDPHAHERQLPPSGEAPVYVRTVEPRHQVIVLE